jgi:DNA-binding response OmpR family regulator
MNSPGFNPCILLAGLEETFAKQAVTDLKEAGYYPVVVPTIERAGADFERLQPAMIMVDRQTGGNEGIALCQHLRSLDR